MRIQTQYSLWMQDLAGITYLVIEGTNVYVISCSTTQAKMKQHEALFDEIAETFRLE